MKTVLLMLGLALTFQARAQLFLTQTGETRFFSKAPLEDISAINKKTGAVLNTQNGDVVVRVPITEFQFPNKLMQEHFNENYLESDKFPYAMFRGKLQDVPD
ncbi:MAG: YceI family protein, partial [Siphonobacter aquaeclarae]|nr:YceI family protein [Siphonobacter aquaeclarae]